MPLTPAHAAAAWPISRVLRRLPLDALVIGTLSPDFQYFFSLAPRGRFGHTLLGLAVFCVPVGLLAWWAYRAFARRVVLSLLPPALRSHDGGAGTRIALVIAAIAVGAASHDLWDSFTHGSGWMVKHVAALSVPVPIGPQTTARGYKLLQQLSTVLGVLALVVWGGRWWRCQPMEARRYGSLEGRRSIHTATFLLSGGAAGALANGLRVVHRGPVAGLGYAAVGGMVGFVIMLVGVGIFRTAGGGSETAA